MESFKTVVKFYKPIVNLTHKQEVIRLYRKSLRTATSWSENRDVFNDEATKIRAEFDQNKSLDAAAAARVLREGHERLQRQSHPDPYIQAYMPGGSLFMRNPSTPMEALFPNGIPPEYSRRRLNIDMSNIPDEQPYADKVFVDSATKSYWINR